MGVRPWQWSLPKMSAADVRLHEAVRNCFASTAERSAVQAAVHAVLVAHLGHDLLFYADGLCTKPFGQCIDAASDGLVCAALSLPPANGAVLLLIDHWPAALMTDRLLGGNGSRGTDPLPLTETELGVLQFLIMQLLAACHTAMPTPAKFHLRFDRFIPRAHDIAEIFPPSEMVSLASWRIGVGAHVGQVRLVLPKSFGDAVQQLRGESSTSPLADLVAQVPRFATDRIPLWMEAGRCELTPVDLAGLEVGDVVVFDACEVQLHDGAVTGHVHLRTGHGAHGALHATLVESPRLSCRVQHFEAPTIPVAPLRR